MSCIYKITNLINNKIYIGQTIDSIEYRLQEHIWDAKRWAANPNKKFNSRLYPAIIKYGENNFKIESVYELKENDDIDQLEQYYIKLFNARDANIGYNIAESGNKPPSRLGWNHSETSKNKMSLAQKNKKWYNNGKTELMFFEHDVIPSGFALGRLNSQGFKSGELNPMFGKHGTNFGKTLSMETKQKISQTKKEHFKHKQMVWYNNGLIEICLNMSLPEAVPNGFVIGRLKSHMNTSKKIKICDMITSEITIFDSCTAAYLFLEISAPTLIKRCKDGKLVKNRFKCKYID